MKTGAVAPTAGEPNMCSVTEIAEFSCAIKHEEQFMRQNIKENEADLLALGNAAADGLDDLAAGMGISPDVETGIRAAATNMTAARESVQLGRGTLRTRQAAVRTAMKAAALFITLMRELLKAHLGSQYSQAWDVVGFVGSLGKPRTTAKMLLLLATIKSYLTANAARENAALNLTAAQADLLLTQLQAAVSALNAYQTEIANRRKARIDNRNLLRFRLLALVADLKGRMGSLDDRWLTFGFNKPGADEKPEVPEGLIAVMVGETAVSFKWPAAARAEQYRIWARVVGVDAELGSIALSADLSFVLESLPRNAVVEIGVSALNNGGESAISSLLTVTTL